MKRSTAQSNCASTPAQTATSPSIRTKATTTTTRKASTRSFPSHGRNQTTHSPSARAPEPTPACRTRSPSTSSGSNPITEPAVQLNSEQTKPSPIAAQKLKPKPNNRKKSVCLRAPLVAQGFNLGSPCQKRTVRNAALRFAEKVGVLLFGREQGYYGLPKSRRFAFWEGAQGFSPAKNPAIQGL